MNKRQFLQRLGSVAGAGAVFQGMQALGLVGNGIARAASPNLAHGSGQGRSVVILGAGISGLAAAWELSKADYQCIVLEATDRAGGRNLTVRHGDVITEVDSRQTIGFDRGDHLYANLGPARIAHHHGRLLRYCKEFDVELEVFSNDNHAAYHHGTTRFDGVPQVKRRVVADTRGYIAELLAKAADSGALDGELTADDRERLLEMLVSYGDLDEQSYRYRGSSRGGYNGPQVNAGLQGGAINPPLDFREILGSDFWQYQLHYSHFLNQAPTMLQPVGGMDAIVRAFEHRVGSRIRYRRVVSEIRHTGTGVRIVHRPAAGGPPEAIEADFAICTIPAPVLREIPNDFAAETRTAIASMEFAPALKIAFQARRRFWEDEQAIYGGISWTDQDITQIWYPPYGYHKEKGILIGGYIFSGEPALRYSDMRPEDRIKAAISEGEAIHPGYGEEIETGASRAWLKAPFQRGAWRRGAKGPEALLRPDGAVHFAGDQVTALSGWQEGAVLAAHEAVNAIHRRVTGR